METTCKRCGCNEFTKNGIVRGKQRYRCKQCKYNFVEGDNREKVSPEGKALAVLLYGTGKSSYGFIAKLFKVSRTAVLKWIRSIAQRLPEPIITSEIKEVEIDEMWHFINEKNKSYGCGGSWIVFETKPADGLSAIVLIKPSKDCMIK